MTTHVSPPFDANVMTIDAASVATALADWLRTTIARTLHRRGAVVAVSGGIDSAVCAGLAVQALGKDRVQALWLPDIASTPASRDQAHALCASLGIPLAEQSIGPALEALGCYRESDEAIRSVFPDHPPSGRYKIAIAADVLDADRANLFDLVVEAPGGGIRRQRLPLPAYLQLVAATNMKQRTRKLIEYSWAEKRNHAVIGTPNRLEYELGFFVRGGDGLADVKPIAHLYKAQVFALAAHLDVPDAIRTAQPSTETYTLPQSQEEFFFALPLRQLDLLLWARTHEVPVAAIACVLQLTERQVERALADVEAKRRAAARLHTAALVYEAIP